MVQNKICGDILKEKLDMKFDKIIMNPPYSIGGKIIDSIKGKAEETIILAPLSNYKHHKNFKYVKEYEVVENGFDADITANLGICEFSSKDENTDWEDLQLKTFDQRYIEFYKKNKTLQKNYRIFEKRNSSVNFQRCDNSSVNDFDVNKDFVESNRLCDLKGGGGFGPGSSFYTFNVNNDSKAKFGAGAAVIHFKTSKEKENFVKWWYFGKKHKSLSSKLQVGLKLKTVSNVCSIAIPQIDWEKISENNLWKEGKYDDAVLEIMGLKIENDFIRRSKEEN